MDSEEYRRIIVNQDGKEIHFRVKKTTQFHRLMRHYCLSGANMFCNEAKFLSFNGRRIRHKDTPEKLGMPSEINNTVEVQQQPVHWLPQKYFNYYPEALSDNTLQSNLYIVLEKLKEIIVLESFQFHSVSELEEEDKNLCSKLLGVIEHIQNKLKNELKEQLGKQLRQCSTCPNKLIDMTMPDLVEKILDIMMKEAISKNNPGLLRFEEPTVDHEYGNTLVLAYDYFSGLYTDILINDQSTKDMMHHHWHSDCLEIISDLLNQDWGKHFDVYEHQCSQLMIRTKLYSSGRHMEETQLKGNSDL